MMKVACIALLVAMASATDTEAPVISLDFGVTAGTATRYNSDSARVPRSGARTAGDTCTGTCKLTNNGERAINDTPDNNAQTDECELKEQSACHLPEAKVYDHYDTASISVTTTVTTYLLGPPGQLPSQPASSPVSCDDGHVSCANTLLSDAIGTRGEYVFKYTSLDAAGNEAQPVVFALIVRDSEAPTSSCTDGSCTSFDLAQTQQKDARAADAWIRPNVNNDLGSSWYKDNADDAFDGQDVHFTGANGYPTNHCSSGNFHFEVSDMADIFGQDNTNNVLTLQASYTVSDTIAPRPTADMNTAEVRSWISGVELHAGDDVQTIECDPTSTFTVSEVSTCTTCFEDNGCECNDATSALTNGEGDCQYNHKNEYTAGQRNAAFGNTFVVGYSASDADTNTFHDSKTFTVVDTSPPVLDITSASGVSHNYAGLCEDGTTTCFTSGVNKRSHVLAAGSQPANGISIETRTANNLFQLAALNSDIIQHSAGTTNDVAQLEELATAYTCTDTCTASPDKATKWFDITDTVAYPKTEDHCDALWQSQVDYATYKSDQGTAAQRNAFLTNAINTNYNLEKVGRYVLMYQCQDDSNHLSAHKCRTIVNEDSTKPIMRMLPDDATITRQASTTAVYTDAGSICSDQVDGLLSEKVEVTGSVVNLAVVGTYRITYNCQDTMGNTAEALIRTIVVEDTVCPVCEVNGDETITTEASFPYTDQGANCVDDIAVDQPTKSAEATSYVNVEETGTYVLTYLYSDGYNSNTDLCTYCTDTNNEATPLVEATAAQCMANTRTVVVADSLKPVINLHYGSLMAESSTSNGYLALALASAAAGVALIGFSASRAPAATSVPV